MEINWGRMKGGKNIGIVGGREGGEGERKVVREGGCSGMGSGRESRKPLQPVYNELMETVRHTRTHIHTHTHTPSHTLPSVHVRNG